MNLDKLLTGLLNTDLSEPLQQVITFTDEPKIPGYICRPNKQSSSKYKCEDIVGHGSGFNSKLAKVKSISEFLERLSIKNPREQDMIQCKRSSQDFVEPALFVHYSDEQVENKELFLENIRNNHYKWFPVYDHYKKKTKFVPAQQIFLSDDFSDEIQITGEQITMGAALGRRNQNNAFETGLLEVIERDFYIISYLQKRKITQVKNLPNKIERFAEYLKRYYLTPYVFDITTNIGVATFMTITLNKTGLGHSVNIGLKSGFNKENIILESMIESIQSRTMSRFFTKMEHENEDVLNENEITSTKARKNYWSATKMIKYLNFWLEDSQLIDFDRLPEYSPSKEDTLKKLFSKNYNVFEADITLPEIKDNGFEVVKVMIPELHPLYLNERTKYLYSKHAGTIKNDKSLKPQPFL